jgi:hypothetical protein
MPGSSETIQIISLYLAESNMLCASLYRGLVLCVRWEQLKHKEEKTILLDVEGHTAFP